MLTWTEALSWPLIVLAVHAVVIPWRWKWRLASKVTIVSLALAIPWIAIAAFDAGKFVGNPRVSDDDYVGAIILYAVLSWTHLTLFGLALCVAMPFDRWKRNE
jgi:hypothetical protein